MKKYISIIFAVLIVISICCGCSLFGSDSNNGVLNIPGKGQKYYKRVVYKGDESTKIIILQYLIIFMIKVLHKVKINLFCLIIKPRYALMALMIN